MFIQTETTPNPASMKFLPGRVLLLEGTLDFGSRNHVMVARSPLARRLFEVEGVDAVFIGHDFITVTSSGQDWAHLKPQVLAKIMEHFDSGDEAMTDGETDAALAEAEEFYEPADADTVRQIKQLIAERVNPAVAQDGGEVVFRGYQDNYVYLTMRGACSSCPSSTATLQYGVQNLLQHFIPEVEGVRNAAV